MHKFNLFRMNRIAAEPGAPEKVISGNPQTRTWNHSSDMNDRLFTGIWEATPGSWAVSYDEWEFCQIISGRAIIRDQLGNEVEISSGDAFVIEPGFEGTWDVRETISKYYVILMPEPIAD